MRTIRPQGAFQVNETLSSELRGLGDSVSVGAHEFLFRRGDNPDGVFLLTSGRVKLSAGPRTSPLTRECLPGALLGLPATLRNRPYSLTAQSTAPCECVRITHSALVEYLRTHPEFCLQVVEVLAQEVGTLRSQLPEEAFRASTRTAPLRKRPGRTRA